MTTLYLATGDGPVIVTRRTNNWRAERPLKPRPPSTSYTFPCIAADPRQPERVFCGLGQQGVWRSDDAGANWRPVFQGIAYDQVTSLAVSATERVMGLGVVLSAPSPVQSSVLRMVARHGRPAKG